MTSPIIVSYSDNKGGASIASYLIFESLKKIRRVEFYCIDKNKKKTVKINNNLYKSYLNFLRILEKILIYFFFKKKFHQSLNIFKTFNILCRLEKNFKLINIHWVNRSMISLGEIFNFKSKTIISLHDMWFFNPTEHYSIGRNKLTNFIDMYCWNLKKKIANKKNTYFIAHNYWMRSKFLKKFPNLKDKIFLCKYYPVNLALFKPRNKKKLREKYNLPINKKIVMFSAQDIHDERKGFNIFLKILNKCSVDSNIFFVTLGHLNQKKKFNNLKNYRHFDFLPNKKSADLYALSDIYLCTSIIDNLPLTIIEALSSGNVVISLDNGGAKEILKKIGYIFKNSEHKKIINIIKNIKKSEIKRKSKLSRQFAISNFHSKKIAIQYNRIFNKVLKVN
ncbi:MAG: hypothetical protein CL556_10590 [Alphaproteobacteria bacterium]|nr:hypothetical protein [Alphaproteobacteria bacterium]